MRITIKVIVTQHPSPHRKDVLWRIFSTNKVHYKLKTVPIPQNEVIQKKNENEKKGKMQQKQTPP